MSFSEAAKFNNSGMSSDMKKQFLPFLILTVLTASCGSDDISASDDYHAIGLYPGSILVVDKGLSDTGSAYTAEFTVEKTSYEVFEFYKKRSNGGGCMETRGSPHDYGCTLLDKQKDLRAIIYVFGIDGRSTYRIHAMAKK